jgi:RNA polymerase sigma factor (sigma-70 family)
MTVTTPNDNELVRLFVQTQRPVYFEQLYRRHYAAVLRTCRTYALHSAEAYDLTQDAFVRAWHGIQSFTYQASFQTWLLTVARNGCIDYLRRQKARDIIFCDTNRYADTSAFDPTADDDLLGRTNRLNKAMALLTDTDQYLFRQHYLDKVPLRELAHQHKISEGAVKMRLLRARTRLRAAF